jgi:putative DNA primase/helicase
MTNVIEQLRSVMRAASIEPPEAIIADGRLHRFYIEGDKRGTCNGWYVLYLDGIPSGAFGSWKTGETHTWRAKDRRAFTEGEWAEYHRKISEARRQKEEAQARDSAKTREKAASIWRRSLSVEIRPYLTRKRVKVYGVRQHRGYLVIPSRDTSGVIHSLQFIDAEGNKRFLSGGAISSHYHPIGQYQGTLCIAEGYATAATIHQATGHAVAVAFNAGNLKPVALALRAKFPEARIIVCGDSDPVGIAKGREAAQAVQGYLALPDFKEVDHG